MNALLYYTDGDNIPLRRREAEFSPQDKMGNTPLRYSSNLLSIDWNHLVENDIPLLNHQRKNSVLHLAGQFSVNPLLLLSKVIQDEHDVSSYTMKSDEEFRMSLKSFANNLSRYDHDYDAESIEIKTSSLEYSLRKAFNDDEEMLNNFLQTCDRLSKKYGITTKSGMTNPMEQHKLFPRNEEEQIRLALPYAGSECWHLGATHFGAQETENSASNGLMSSIDMAPSLFQKWGVSFDYLFSNGDVYSSHSGYVKKHSECSIEVKHDRTKYSTYFSHLDLNDIGEGVFIEQGENIGRISLDPDRSNCRCDWPNKSFLCSTGPHLHMELRYDGKPASLQNHVISNLRINVGILPHDMYCSDPVDCTSATFEGKRCSTTFTDITTDQVICPVTKGSNIGKSDLRTH